MVWYDTTVWGPALTPRGFCNKGSKEVFMVYVGGACVCTIWTWVCTVPSKEGGGAWDGTAWTWDGIEPPKGVGFQIIG